ncbi:MAG: ATP-binding protein [Dehalococcoidia bacterium]
MERIGEILSRNANVGSSPLIGLTSRSDEVAADEPDGLCPECGGAGFVRRDLPLDHPRFGKAEPCSCILAESDAERRERLARLSNLSPLAHLTFEALVRTPLEGLIAEEQIEAAKEYAAGGAGWLVVSGASGSGKTVLAAAIANARIEAGLAALYMVAADLLDHLRGSYEADGRDMGYEQMLGQVKETPMLILDDIDAVAATDWAREKLFQVLNHRLVAGLATVLTCSDSRRLDERIQSRLRSGLVAQLRLGGSLYRFQEVGGMTGDRLALLTFSNFDLRGTGLQAEERESLIAAHAAAREFAERPEGFLTFLGVNGCGKTHLAAAVANRALASGLSVFFAVVPDLLDELRPSDAPGRSSSGSEVWRGVRESDVVVLDDLGAQVGSSWAQEKLFQIVNYRSVSGRATAITSDCGREQLATAHPRIAARVLDPRQGVTIALIAPHYALGRMGLGRGGQQRR